MPLPQDCPSLHNPGASLPTAHPISGRPTANRTMLSLPSLARSASWPEHGSIPSAADRIMFSVAVPGGGGHMRSEAGRTGPQAARLKCIISDRTDVSKANCKDDGIVPIDAQPLSGAKGRRSPKQTNSDCNQWERPLKKHKPLAEEDSRVTGGEVITYKRRDVLRRRFLSLGSAERNRLLRNVKEEQEEEEEEKRDLFTRKQGRAGTYAEDEGCEKERSKDQSVGEEVQTRIETVNRLQDFIIPDSEDGKSGDTSDDMNHGYIQKYRRKEKKRHFEEFHVKKEFLISYTRKSKRKPRTDSEKDSTGQQFVEAFSKRALAAAASDSRHVNLGDDVRPLDKRVGFSFKHDKGGVQNLENKDIDERKWISNKGSEFKPEEDRIVFKEKEVSKSAGDIGYYSIAGHLDHSSNRTIVPGILSPTSKVSSGSADGDRMIAVESEPASTSCNPFAHQKGAHEGSASIRINLTGDSEREGEINWNSQAVQSGEIKEKEDAVLKEEVKLNLSEGRICGLCGGGSDGEPPNHLIPGHNRKSEDQALELERLHSPYSDWDEFACKPGWLGRLLGPLGERVGIAGVWVHQECAVWSPEVYFGGVGHLKNVRSALRRGRLLKCSRCGEPGATIGCRVDRCPRTYHLPCSRFEGCLFDHKKYLMACPDHLDFFLPQSLGNGIRRSQPGLKKMVCERKKAAEAASQKDLEAEEKWLENKGEDEEFARRECRRLQRDFVRVAPVVVGGFGGDQFSEGWDSVAGLQSVVQCMKEMVILPLLYPDAFTKLGITPPRGLLLHGHPGTGKTLAVRALVGACAKGDRRIAYFARKGADCLGKYVGDAERQLRLLFQVAEQHQPSIIFFDEIDGLAPKRSQHQDQTQKSVVSTLLALMDGLKSRGSVIVIGATNRPDALDPALRRPGRFDREIHFPLPSTADRAAILALHTRKWETPPDSGLLSFLARETSGFAGADLQALCAQAAMIALKRTTPVQHLLDTIEFKGAHKFPPLPALNVKPKDWVAALEQAPLPCSRREAKAAVNDVTSTPLSRHLAVALLWPMVEVLGFLHLDSRVTLPPVLEKAAVLIEAALKSAAGGHANSLMDLIYSARSRSTSTVFRTKLQEALEDALCTTGLIFNVDADQQVFAETNSQTEFSGSRFCVMLSGDQMSGQGLLASWILYGFEGFAELCKLSLPTMLQEGGGDVSQGLLQILCKVRSICPCVVFMPQIEAWAVETINDGEGKNQPKASECWNLFMQQMNLMPINTSVVILALCEASDCQLPPEIVQFFTGAQSHALEHPLLSSCSKDHLSCEEIKLETKTECSGKPKLCCRSIPCAWIQMPTCVDTNQVFDQAAQYYTKVFSTRFSQTIYCSQRTLHPSGNCRSEVRISKCQLNSAGLQEFAGKGHLMDSKENSLEQGLRTEGEGVFVEHSFRSAEMSQSDLNQNCCSPIFQEHLQNMRHSKQLMDGQCNKSSPVHVESSAEIFSAEQRALSLAIATCGYQLLHHPQLAELRRETSKLSEGPFFHSPMQHKGGLSGFSDVSSCQKDGKDTFLVLRGLSAVGFLAYKGLYGTSLEVAFGVRKVLELLMKRINEMVDGGKDRLQFFRLLCQVADLEDKVFAWAHELQSLEVAAKVPLQHCHRIKQNSPKLENLSRKITTRNTYLGREAEGNSPIHHFQADDSDTPHTAVCANNGQASDRRVSSKKYKKESATPFLNLDLHGQWNLQSEEACIAADSDVEADITRHDNALSAAKQDMEQVKTRLALGDLCKFLKEPDVDMRKDVVDKKHVWKSGQPDVDMRKYVVDKKHVWKSCPECMSQVEHALKELFKKLWRQRGAISSLDVANDVIGSCSASISAMFDRLQGVRERNGKRPKSASVFQWSIMPDAFACECLKKHKLERVFHSHIEECDFLPGLSIRGKELSRFSIKDLILADVKKVSFRDQVTGLVPPQRGEFEDTIYVCLCPLLKIIICMPNGEIS